MIRNGERSSGLTCGRWGWHGNCSPAYPMRPSIGCSRSCGTTLLRLRRKGTWTFRQDYHSYAEEEKDRNSPPARRGRRGQSNIFLTRAESQAEWLIVSQHSSVMECESVKSHIDSTLGYR